jgi:GTPase SAR1 family protein
VLRPDQAEQDEIVARLVDDITGQMVNVTNTVIDPKGPTGMHRWTSNRLLAAEAELLEAAHTGTVFVPPAGDVVPEFGDQLSVSQRAAALGVSTSTRQLDVLVGPAGSGKTTTMRALADHWRTNGGRVLGLATSQVAADQLAEAAGIEAENTARWFAAANSRCRTYGADPSDPAQWATWGAHLEPGTLIIVDEAAMVPTLDLQRIQQAAAVAGCKVLAVGDPLQLDAPGAGGAFGLMVSDDRVNALHLEEIHRFQHAWEREASTRMREGDGTVVDLYAEHQRIHGGTEAEMYTQVLDAWIADQPTSETVMVTQTNDQASALARAAREHLIGGERSTHTTRWCCVTATRPAPVTWSAPDATTARSPLVNVGSSATGTPGPSDVSIGMGRSPCARRTAEPKPGFLVPTWALTSSLPTPAPPTPFKAERSTRRTCCAIQT